MATVLNTGDIVRTTIVVAQAEQTALLGHSWVCGSFAGSSATDLDMAVALDTVVSPLITVFLANLATYKGTIAQKVIPLPIPARQISVAGAGAGTAGATLLPRQACVVTTWYTPLAGRAQRARTFWPFLASTSLTTSGTVQGGTQTAIAALAAAIRALTVIGTGGNTINVALCLQFKRTGIYQFINNQVTNHLFATQKRRGSYGRANVSPI